MTIYSGFLRKMQTSYSNADTAVEYSLSLANTCSDDADYNQVQSPSLVLNTCLEKTLSIRFRQAIHCVVCARKTNKSFNQGHCYPCFSSLAACDICIMSPEKCHYQQGTCRQPQWGETHCFQDHYVYLANSSGLKVGITRGDQLPTRWIDQGALQALPIFKVSQRYYSGLVETLYKQEVSDRTQWQRMLKGQVEAIDLLAKQSELADFFSEQLGDLINDLGENSIVAVENKQMTEIKYPIIEHPEKVKSFNLDKQAIVEGTLLGIKGQYLIFDNGVLNLRKFSGYSVDIEVLD